MMLNFLLNKTWNKFNKAWVKNLLIVFQSNVFTITLLLFSLHFLYKFNRVSSTFFILVTTYH